jgi:hypothetical protein
MKKASIAPSEALVMDTLRYTTVKVCRDAKGVLIYTPKFAVFLDNDYTGKLESIVPAPYSEVCVTPVNLRSKNTPTLTASGGIMASSHMEQFFVQNSAPLELTNFLYEASLHSMFRKFFYEDATGNATGSLWVPYELLSYYGRSVRLLEANRYDAIHTTSSHPALRILADDGKPEVLIVACAQPF